MAWKFFGCFSKEVSFTSTFLRVESSLLINAIRYVYSHPLSVRCLRLIDAWLHLHPGFSFTNHNGQFAIP